ncbi:NfeD family protein [Hamadaea tsunoensis]|uniref:NfeD family protein n=1 Tax=Hamadaea tsunoensis TaxID=53368 RepID=UPI0004274A7C|nr:NfeD family protein [Hamadaea tsunoensis]
MESWGWWLVAAGALVIGELFAGDFVLLMLAAGAAAAGLAGVLGLGIVGELLVFVVVSGLALFFVRPWIKNRFYRSSDQVKIGVSTILGAEAVVLERVDAEGGQVNLSGELWRARPYDTTRVFEPGDRVRVIEVDGATVLVGKE